MSQLKTFLSVSWQDKFNVSDSDTPFIRWCIVVIAVLAIWFWFVEPLQAWTKELQASLDRNEAKASRLASLDENKDAWIKAESLAVQTLAAIEADLFILASNTIAQAEIQKVLQEFAVSRQLNLESQKLLGAESLGSIGNKLAVEIGVRGELINILQYLDDISRTNKLFIIDRWIIQMDRNNKAYARLVVSGIRPLVGEGLP